MDSIKYQQTKKSKPDAFS